MMKLDKIMGSNQRLPGVFGHFQGLFSYFKICWWSLSWVCIVLSTGYAVPPAGAEPSPSIQFLMREPVTMMDWGLRNIEEYLYRQRDLLMQANKRLFESEPVVAVSYDWEQNKIQVAITLWVASQIQLTSRDLADIRAHLQRIIKYLRGTLTMKPFDAFFRHRGFRNQDSPQNLGVELAGQTNLLIRVRDADANILSQCKGELTDSKIIWLNIGNQ